MLSCSTTNALVGGADEGASDNSRTSQLRSTFFTKVPNRLPVFRWVNNARVQGSTLGLGGPVQTETLSSPGDEDSDGRKSAELAIWSHDKCKCAVIMYESFAKVTVFLPPDFHGVVWRVGQSGRSIACSRPALYLKDSNNLRFNDVPDETEDLVLVHTEKVLRVCVDFDDPFLPHAARGQSFSED